MPAPSSAYGYGQLLPLAELIDAAEEPVVPYASHGSSNPVPMSGRPPGRPRSTQTGGCRPGRGRPTKRMDRIGRLVAAGGVAARCRVGVLVGVVATGALGWWETAALDRHGWARGWWHPRRRQEHASSRQTKTVPAAGFSYQIRLVGGEAGRRLEAQQVQAIAEVLAWLAPLAHGGPPPERSLQPPTR
jgi:hypothetical protein